MTTANTSSIAQHLFRNKLLQHNRNHNSTEHALNKRNHPIHLSPGHLAADTFHDSTINEIPRTGYSLYFSAQRLRFCFLFERFLCDFQRMTIMA